MLLCWALAKIYPDQPESPSERREFPSKRAPASWSACLINRQVGYILGASVFLKTMKGRTDGLGRWSSPRNIFIPDTLVQTRPSLVREEA
ncbi:predicted protein [Coccidioides posadasii str. Silveira]|uniref:Predicted protein n=1 Tax=Coccidioides posadasii (strain RMSCC 757 / Silveira) TaxID=443226 RepID=E9CW44_COCPS|nr:predicted protein [Coccidioides posadasii str. Silveira]